MSIRKGVGIVLVSLCVVAIGFWAFISVWTGDPKEIIGVANQFKPDSSWKLVSETITPPKFCFTGPCPQISRTWQTEQFVNSTNLQIILDQAGWKDVKINQECFKNVTVESNSQSVCSARGQSDKYSVFVFVNTNDEILKTPTVNLLIH